MTTITEVKSFNIIWHKATVTSTRREQMNDHCSTALWFTGLSGVGKSTLAHADEETLHQYSSSTFVFDGDKVIYGLYADLYFPDKDRTKKICRIGEMNKPFLEVDGITLTAFASPFRADRNACRLLTRMAMSSKLGNPLSRKPKFVSTHLQGMIDHGKEE